jgi:N-acetylneuraminic acid mutarotase
MRIIRLNRSASGGQYTNVTVNQPVTTTVTQATGNLEVIPYGQAVNIANLYANKTGETFNTPITVPAPVNNNNAATRKFLNDTITPLTSIDVTPILNQYANKSGDVFTGPISRIPDPYDLNNAPTNPNTAITNKFANDKLTQAASSASVSNSVETGQIYEIFATSTPPGYLKCNGANVSKTTYSDLYNAIGDQFAPLTTGGGIPWQSQCGFNSSTQNIITDWSTTNSLAFGVSNSVSLVTKNYVYVLGGYNGSGAINTIQRASFNSNGDLTSGWSNVGAIPVVMYSMGYAATKGRYYLIGGYSGSNSLSSVYSSPINSDGTLGTFRTETSLPAERADAVCFVIKNKLYVAGGGDTNTVYQAIINNDGTLTNWATLPNFPINFSSGTPLLIKDRIYIFGIRIPSSSNSTSKIYYATYDSNGNIDSWTYVSDMPNNIYGSAIVCTDNYVFSIGGKDAQASQFTNATYRAPILADGSIGTWTQISNGPVIASYAQVAIAGDKIYFIGGYYYSNNSANIFNTVYSASFTSGITDYTPYYTDQSNTSSTFNLPNLPSTPYSAYYIKT